MEEYSPVDFNKPGNCSINKVREEKTVKVRIHLHDQPYRSKPEGRQIQEISSTITRKITETGIQELAVLAGEEGRAFTPAVFQGARRKENFICQQVYALDFDEGFSIKQFEERAEKYDIKPAFLYQTFSSTAANPRFRAVFVNDCEIADAEAASILIRMLQMIFTEADPGCKDVSRIFFGGKALYYIHPRAVMNLFDLALSLQAYLADQNKKNYGRKIVQVGRKLNVEVKNKILCIHRFDQIHKEEKSEDFNAMTSIILVNAQKSSLFYVIEKAQTKEGHRCSRCKKRNGSGRARNVTARLLKEECMLFKDFCETEIAHDFKFLIATNLLQMHNGKQLFFSGRISHVEKWEQTWKYLKHNEYFPWKCGRSGCPYYEQCGSATILERMTDKIRKTRDETFVDIHEAEKLLGEAMEEAVMSGGKGIHLIMAQTALGKTYTYCRIVKKYHTKKPFMIVVPTNKLQEEVGRELEGMEVPVFLTANIDALLERLHLPELKAEVEVLYKRGFGFRVKSLIKNYIKENRGELGVWQLKKLREYLASSDKLDGSACVVTTHVMFLSLPYEKISRYEVIVDEDLLMTVFKNTSSVSFGEMKLALETAAVPKKKAGIIQKLLCAGHGDMVKGNNEELTLEELQRLYDQDLQINTSFTDFLQADIYHVDVENGKVDFFNARKIPDMKMTVVSATLNEELYRNYCRGSKIFTAAVPAAKYKGKLIQYSAHSMSRSNMENIGFGIIMEKVDEIVGDLERNVITFKKFSPDAEIYFGKTEGFNEYKGKDLAVIGTPHNVPFLYNLIGAYLGYRTDDRLSVRYVENGMYAFPFMTFRDKEIRNLQFYFIESELEQAIGRARILRHDCTVYLFSNFLCRQAQLRQEICFPEE